MTRVQPPPAAIFFFIFLDMLPRLLCYPPDPVAGEGGRLGYCSSRLEFSRGGFDSRSRRVFYFNFGCFLGDGTCAVLVPRVVGGIGGLGDVDCACIN